MDLELIQDAGMGGQFAEFIMHVTKGEYDGKMGRSRLIAQTGVSVDAGDLTRQQQSLILREWMHLRRQPQRRGGEEEAGTGEEG